MTLRPQLLAILGLRVEGQYSGSSERGRCRWGRSETPHFPSELQSFALVSGELIGEKRRKTKKSEEKRRKAKKNRKKRRKTKKGENSSDPIYTNPIKNLPKYHQNQKFCNKKILRGINLVKITKYFPALIQNLATPVCFLCNIHAATNSRKNYKNKRKKNGRELICKKIGVNGKVLKTSLMARDSLSESALSVQNPEGARETPVGGQACALLGRFLVPPILGGLTYQQSKRQERSGWEEWSF